jgi:HAD superfamily hydrolase (TIGR01509 family)
MSTASAMPSLPFVPPFVRHYVNATGSTILPPPKAVIFDLDGVLADLCEMHRDLFIECFNEAVTLADGTHPDPSSGIQLMTTALHAEKLEGMSTKLKLTVCADLFPDLTYDSAAINRRKQERTIEALSTMSFPTRAHSTFVWARAAGLKVAVYTNSIRATLDIVLERLGLTNLCDLTLSNEDVPAAKPSPSGYNLAIAKLGLTPAQVLIFEDSVHGMAAARGSGAVVIPILNSMDVTPEFVRRAVETRASPIPAKIRLVIPLAGIGTELKAFAKTPKGVLMWHAVVMNLLPTDPALLSRIEVHVIVSPSLYDKFQESLMTLPNIHVNLHIATHTLVPGPLSTVLTLRDLINDSLPVLIANADQFLEYDRGVNLFYHAAFHPSYDGAVSTFYNPFPDDLRWSYMTVSTAGLLMSIQEKKFVGPYATTGIYAWCAGELFVRYADAVLRDGVTVRGSVYVAQVYAQAVAEGLRFRSVPCDSITKLSDVNGRDAYLAKYHL